MPLFSSRHFLRKKEYVRTVLEIVGLAKGPKKSNVGLSSGRIIVSVSTNRGFANRHGASSNQQSIFIVIVCQRKPVWKDEALACFLFGLVVLRRSVLTEGGQLQPEWVALVPLFSNDTLPGCGVSSS